MTEPKFVQAGIETDKIHVRLSYRIVRLFSEGLYASPNKAIEELVANSFDAGALRVAVFLPSDFHDQAATIAVLDDGEGMDAEGLKQHWLIGKSLKRELRTLPRGRNQIGQFGIGKLATYVLANRLTHISKKGGKYYATSMNFKDVDDRGEEEIEPKAPIKISLRELTLEEAREAVKPWTDSTAFKRTGIKLFGAGAPKSWTLAILSRLKEKVHEIGTGVLSWVLRTALPLRDDFSIYLNGDKLEASKAGKDRIKHYVLGKDITELPKPAPKKMTAVEDKNQADPAKRFALEHKPVGRITGYAEIYKNLLTGKSDELGRSHGFFVYVRGRLINVKDGHFGISPDELRHGTFGRIRVVVHMDGLDPFLQSDRERIREGPVLVDAQNILRGVFNEIRRDLEKADAGEEPGAKLARNLASSPASLARRPIVDMARAALHGKIRSRYIAFPLTTTSKERDRILSNLEDRVEHPEQFVSGLDILFDATSDDPIAVYDAVSSRLRVNGLHPFIGAFFDEFTGKTSGLPLELFAMAEVLLESHLHQAGLKQDQIDQVMDHRDQLLRYVAQQSGRRTALTVANALRHARNNEAQLEIELVEAFRSLGFDATRIAKSGTADGVAKAHLSPGPDGKPRRYAVSLEAKSKKKPGAKLSTKNLGVSTIARQRDDANCDHAIVVAPAFNHTVGKQSALAKEIKEDRANTKARGAAKTITAMHVDDLARLVQLRPVKRLGLARIRTLLQTFSLPEECKAWVDVIEKEAFVKPPYAQIINAIHALQQEYDMAPVEYSGLRVTLGRDTPPYKVSTNDELVELCKAMAAMASNEITATDRTVELNQSPANVLAAIESATKAYPDGKH
jgi:histidine kinase/DNA gyrase B/HSP90-like ATPase